MDGAGKVLLNSRWHRLSFFFLAGVCLYWFGPTWYLHLCRTWDPFAFNDDARILIWPFLRSGTPGLFPGDPFVDYYLAGLPEGYSALYRVFGWLFCVKAASETLSYLSVLATAACLGLTARRLGGSMAAFVTTVLVLGSEPFLDRAGGALPRAFAFPLVSAGIYALVLGRPRMLAALAVAGAAFYPVVAALLGLSLFLLLTLPERWRAPTSCAPHTVVLRHRRWVPRIESRPAMLLITLTCIVVLLVPMSLRLRAYGDVITPAMLPDFPEAALGGRLTPEQHPPFENFSTVFARHARGTLLGIGAPIGGRAATWLRAEDTRTSALLFAIVGLSAARILLAARRRPELLRLWLLPIAAWIGHALACQLAPRLFLPERYAQFSVPPFIALLVAAGFTIRPDADVSTVSPYRFALRLGAVALLVAILGGRGTSWVGTEVYVPLEERPLYSAISRLPIGSVIAGWPIGPIENVPYLSERRVLTNFQLEMPFHTKFTLESRARLGAFFDAYFATSPDPLRRLCSEFHVTHLLVDSKHFSAISPDYYAPHRQAIAMRHAAAQAAAPWLLSAAANTNSTQLAPGLKLLDLSTIAELGSVCRSRETQS